MLGSRLVALKHFRVKADPLKCREKKKSKEICPTSFTKPTRSSYSQNQASWSISRQTRLYLDKSSCKLCALKVNTRVDTQTRGLNKKSN